MLELSDAAALLCSWRGSRTTLGAFRNGHIPWGTVDGMGREGPESSPGSTPSSSCHGKCNSCSSPAPGSLWQLFLHKSCSCGCLPIPWLSLGCAGGSLAGPCMDPLLLPAPPIPPEAAEPLVFGTPHSAECSLVASPAVLETKIHFLFRERAEISPEVLGLPRLQTAHAGAPSSGFSLFSKVLQTQLNKAQHHS